MEWHNVVDMLSALYELVMKQRDLLSYGSRI